MRLLVHDYAGHPYAVQLSRTLARRGVEVLHVYSSSNPMPQGTLARQTDDPPTFQVQPVSLGEKIQKADFVKRRAQEIRHAQLVDPVIRDFKPDVLISGSAPLDTQNGLWKTCRVAGVAPVFWLQDLTGVATEAVLRKKLPLVGPTIGRYYTRMEERLLRESAGVVAISEDFLPALDAAGVARDRVSVIENWGPIAELPTHPKDNVWSRRMGLHETFNFVYSGTLGMKHNPELILQLAYAFHTDSKVRVLAITEGIGRRWLEQKKAEHGLDRLILLDFQPFSEVPYALATADVLVAILEPEAGVYSVPSKVLAYLCAGRPILLAVPPQNLAARIVETAHAGKVAHPDDIEEFMNQAKNLYTSAELQTYGTNARAYAERTFDIESVADSFSVVFDRALAAHRSL